ncbi:MAG: DUF4198 domain-containing protein [Sporomusaceae bacterium]|nr:DUF4198 domain-containing protein [Sporomusaceae bacterium]
MNLNGKRWLTTAACLAMLTAVAVPAQAHGVWFASRLDQVQLVLGEGFKDNAYDPAMVKELKGYDAQFAPLPITAINGGNHITIDPPQGAAVVTVAFDYGYWSNGRDGKWHNQPMDQVPGSTIGTHAIKYSVNYLGPVETVKALPGLPYQIVPAVDPTRLEVGDLFTVQVLHEGKPLPNVDLIPDVVNHHTVTLKTDAAGKAVIPVANGGINVVGIELAVPYEGKDQKATRSKVFSGLSFTIYPQEAD